MNALTINRSSAATAKATTGESKRVPDPGGLYPIDPAGAATGGHQLSRDPDADDRPDQCGSSTLAGPGPRAKVPEHGRDREREHHGEAGFTANRQDELDRQERDDAEGDRAI
jgi:hypothetical protein